MPDNPRIQQVLEQLLDSGSTPEEACRTCPELLPEVRTGWQRLRALKAEIGALFPASPTADGATPPPLPTAGLPRIRGYEVQEELGRGGMGVVYKAWHQRLNRAVALKMLLAGPYARPEELERFLHEAETVAGLPHTNIVQVHEAGDLDGRPYFTMEFVAGGSLAQKLAGTPQPAREAAALVAVVAEAVHAAHLRGIVHRDLKPGNILLTADGTPKVTDFGLARRLESGGGLTLTGVPMGTPSYMAPEQGQGRGDSIGPATDVYALGAILYELLTGRPPFRAETAAETVLQVIHQDPVPPSRLNAKVPRDLETICLKCLHKDPQRRYATAAALALDLGRFQRGEPIGARPAGFVERTVKWVRRRPSQSALLAGGVLFAIVLAGVGFWLSLEKDRQRHAAEADLKRVADLQERALWKEAKIALESAEARVGGGGPEDLLRQFRQARRDLDLVFELDAIRLRRATSGDSSVYRERADQDYEAAFRNGGLGAPEEPSSRVAVRVKASTVRGALLATLDDWAVCAADKIRRGWLLEVATLSDPVVEKWHSRIRDLSAWDNPVALAELGQTVPVVGQPVSLLLGLGERLKAAGGDAHGLLRRVQREHPDNFWANLLLGNALLEEEPQEAVSYYHAALASRPRDAVAYCAVGDALSRQRKLEDAIAYYHKALACDPKYARGHTNLGLALEAKGLLDEAIGYHQKALQFDPKYAWVHYTLGNALLAKGQQDEAIDHFQQAVRIDPKNAALQYHVGNALRRKGRWDDAIDHYKQAILADSKCSLAHYELGDVLRAKGQFDEAMDSYQRAIAINPKNPVFQNGFRGILLRQGRGKEARVAWEKLLADNPPEHDAWAGYAELCLFLGHQDEYRRAREALLRRFGTSMEPFTAEQTCRACLLLPASDEELRQCAALADRALAAKDSLNSRFYPYFLLAKGLAEYRQGRLKSAVAIMEGEASRVMNPVPQIVVAMAQLRAENPEAARKTLATAILAFDWRAEWADNRDSWIRHVLRREAEAMIFPNLASFLRGNYHVQDNYERLGLLGICQFQGTYAAAARLYADAFVDDPGLAEDRKKSHRFRAASYAALAGCGHGTDAATLSSAERVALRIQARVWLHDELSAYIGRLKSNPSDSALVRQSLAQWQANPALAGLREARALDKLPVEERMECTQLWEKVGAVVDSIQVGR